MNKSNRGTFLIDTIIALVISFFLVGIGLKFKANDQILLFIVSTVFILLISYSWYKLRTKSQLNSEGQVLHSDPKEKNIDESQVDKPVKKEIVTSIPFPVGDFKNLAGTYTAIVESFWNDSDADTHYDQHDVFLLLEKDGTAISGPIREMKSTQPETYQLKGFWNAQKENEEIAFELLLPEIGLLKDPGVEIPNDIKYYGEFRDLSWYLKDGNSKGEGYYKGTVELKNESIQIAGLTFEG